MRRSLCLFMLLSAILAVNAYAIEELGNTLNEDLVKRQANPGVPNLDAEAAGENETGEEDPTNEGEETLAGEGETPAEELPPAVPVEEPKPAEVPAKKPKPAKHPKPAGKPKEIPADEASPEDAIQEGDIPGEVPTQDDTLVGEENAGGDTDPDVGAPVNPAPSKPHKPVHNVSTAPNQHKKPVKNPAHRGVRRQPVRRGQNQRRQPQHKVTPRQNRQQNRRPNKVQNRRPTTVRRVANNRKRVNQNRRPAQRSNNRRRRVGK